MEAGMQETGMIARFMKTGVETVLKAEDILAVIIASRATKESRIFADYIENQHGSICNDISVPKTKVKEFVTDMQELNIPFSIVSDDKSEFAQVICRGGIPEFDEKGRVLLDKNGNKVFKQGSSRDEVMTRKLAEKHTNDFLKDKNISINRDKHMLSTNEANHEFYNKATIKVRLDSASKAFEIQKHAAELNIDSFITTKTNKYEIEGKTEYNTDYFVEFKQSDAERLNEDTMSPVEQVLTDCRYAFSVPEIKNYLISKDMNDKFLAKNISNLNKSYLDCVIVPFDADSFDREHLPHRIDIEHGKATELKGNQIIETYDLTKKDDLSKLETKIQSFDGASSFKRDGNSYSWNSWLKNEEHCIDIPKQIQYQKNNREKFKDIRKVAFRATEFVSNNPNAGINFGKMGTLTTDLDKGHKYMIFDQEIDKIVVGLISENSNGQIDLEHFTNSLNHNSEEFNISIPAMYEPVGATVFSNIENITKENEHDLNSSTPENSELNFDTTINENGIDTNEQTDFFSDLGENLEESIETVDLDGFDHDYDFWDQ